MSARVLALAALLLISSIPLASAVVGPAAAPRDSVSQWSASSQSISCHPGDPVVGLVTTSAGSYVEYAPASAGRTRYTLHLAQLAPDAGCPEAIDLSFTALMAPWPTTPVTLTVTLHCGALGTLYVYPSDHGPFFWLNANIPASCNAGIVGSWGIGVGVAPLHPALLVVCSPVTVVSGVACVGPNEWQGAGTCPSGARPGGTAVGLTSISRDCYDGERVTFYPIGLLIWFEFTQSSCTVYVQDPLVGVVDVKAACPAQLSGFFWGSAWGQMLP